MAMMAIRRHRQITAMMATARLPCPSTGVPMHRHIGGHALPKMISRSQRQGAYSGTVPESIFLMAL